MEKGFPFCVAAAIIIDVIIKLSFDNVGLGEPGIGFNLRILTLILVSASSVFAILYKKMVPQIEASPKGRLEFIKAWLVNTIVVFGFAGAGIMILSLFPGL